MSERSELLVTLLLVSACLLVAAVSLVPKVVARDVPIRFESPEITVHVDGAVAVPGVYRLPFRSRVADALELAGGVTAQAEVSLVNLAGPLGPGDRVYVPDKQTADRERRVSINSASASELQALPGVGPVTARRIVDGRPYLELEDLLRVKGIGEKTLQRLREHVRL